MGAISSCHSWQKCDHELFAPVAHDKKERRERFANFHKWTTLLLTKNERFALKTDEQIPNPDWMKGWVNLYQKFEIKNIQFVVNSFYQKNGKAFKKFFLAQLACEFACICEYLHASCIQTFKDMHSKIWQKVVLLKYFKFCYYMHCKKINF